MFNFKGDNKKKKKKKRIYQELKLVYLPAYNPMIGVKAHQRLILELGHARFVVR
jgi:hypothetical protein